jgi:hypothetical protein
MNNTTPTQPPHPGHGEDAASGTTGGTPAHVVITYNIPDPGQCSPNPQVVRDNRGRIRVCDDAGDRLGWADLRITWEDVDPGHHPYGEATDHDVDPRPLEPYTAADLVLVTEALTAVWDRPGSTPQSLARAALDALGQTGRLGS